MPTDAELLASYLADRDVACPGCGYNLRGSSGTCCPECGAPLGFSLGQTAIHRRELWLIRSALIVLVVHAGVQLVGGTVNLVRVLSYPGRIDWLYCGTVLVSSLACLGVASVAGWLLVRSRRIGLSSGRQMYVVFLKLLAVLVVVYLGSEFLLLGGSYLLAWMLQ